MWCLTKYLFTSSAYLDIVYFTENWKLKIIKKYISVTVHLQNHCLLPCLHCSCPINSATGAGLKKKKKKMVDADADASRKNAIQT